MRRRNNGVNVTSSAITGRAGGTDEDINCEGREEDLLDPSQASGGQLRQVAAKHVVTSIHNT